MEKQQKTDAKNLFFAHRPLRTPYTMMHRYNCHHMSAARRTHSLAGNTYKYYLGTLDEAYEWAAKVKRPIKVCDHCTPPWPGYENGIITDLEKIIRFRPLISPRAHYF